MDKERINGEDEFKEQGEDYMIPVKVKEIVMDQWQHPLLLLSDLEESLVLPMGIGFWEAQTIARKWKGEETSRPMTHDLMCNLFQHLEVQVKRIEIHDVYENTFYANIYMERNGKEEVVDSRPSDAVALALTVDTAVYLTENIRDYTVSMDELHIEEVEDEVRGEEGAEEDEGEGPWLQ